MAISSSTPTIIEIDQYNGRITLFVIMACMIATLEGAIFGYDIGITGGIVSMEPFLEKFFQPILGRMKNETAKYSTNYCRLDSHLLVIFISSLYIVAAFASLIAAPITHTHGRRLMMMIGGITSLVGVVMGGVAGYVWMLILGRVLQGVGVGLANQAVPLYLSEMSLPIHRGAFGVAFRFSQGLGFILASLINFVSPRLVGRHAWRLAIAFAAAPATFLTLGAAFLPETPTALIQRGALQNAVGTLQRIRGTADVLTELNDVVGGASCDQHQSAMSFGSSYQSIIRREFWPQLMTAVAIPFFSQLTGSVLVSFYAPILLRNFGHDESTSLLLAVVLGLIGLAANTAAAMSVDRLGRRPLLMTGGALMLVSLLAIGGATVGNLGGGFLYFELVMSCVFHFAFELSWGPAGWFLPSEIFPTQIRSAGQSIAVAVNFLVAAAVAQSFLGMFCAFRERMFFFFSGWAAAMTAFAWFLLPETKGVPMEQMEAVWRCHWFWRRIYEAAPAHGEGAGPD